jgi:sugar-specific transcriptional regulator TrmB
LERIIKTLEAFGLSRVDAKVYIYLSKTGPQNVEELIEALKMTKQQVLSSIKNLRDKGIVASSVGHPILFCAFSFEKVLEILINTEIEHAKTIRETKKELLSNWSHKDWKDKTLKQT